MSGFNPFGWNENAPVQSNDFIYKQEVINKPVDTTMWNPVHCYTRLYYGTYTDAGVAHSYKDDANPLEVNGCSWAIASDEKRMFVFGNRNGSLMDTYYVNFLEITKRFIVRDSTSHRVFLSPPVIGNGVAYDPRSVCCCLVSEGAYQNNRIALFVKDIAGGGVLGGVYSTTSEPTSMIWKVTLEPQDLLPSPFPWTDIRFFYDKRNPTTQALIINGNTFYDVLRQYPTRYRNAVLETGDSGAMAFPALDRQNFFVVSKNNIGINSYVACLNAVESPLSPLIGQAPTSGVILPVGGNRFVQDNGPCISFTHPTITDFPTNNPLNSNYKSIARWSNDGTNIIYLPLYMKGSFMSPDNQETFMGLGRLGVYLFFEDIKYVNIVDETPVYAFDNVIVVDALGKKFYFPNKFGHSVQLGTNWSAGVFYTIDPNIDPDYTPFAPKVLVGAEYRENLVTFCKNGLDDNLRAVSGVLPDTTLVSGGLYGSGLGRIDTYVLSTPDAVIPTNRDKSIIVNILPA